MEKRCASDVRRGFFIFILIAQNPNHALPRVAAARRET